MPPTGKMCPRKVISPVTAVSLRTGRSCSMEISVTSDLRTKCGSLSCCPADGKMFFWNKVSRLDVSRLDVSDVNSSWVALNFTPNHQHIFYLQHDIWGATKIHVNRRVRNLNLLKSFFGEEGWTVSFLPFCGRLHLWDPPVFCQKSPASSAMTSSSGYAQSQLVMQLKFVVFLGVTVLSSHSVPCMFLTIVHPFVLAELLIVVHILTCIRTKNHHNHQMQVGFLGHNLPILLSTETIIPLPSSSKDAKAKVVATPAEGPSFGMAPWQ